jgi:Nucleotide modification associated domain 1
LNKTSEQYDQQISLCRELFAKKTKDYGTSWRVLRPKSLTDQLFIKAQRIKTLEEAEVRKVDEGIEPEFIGLVNYAVMGLIQLKLDNDPRLELSEKEALELYDAEVAAIKALMLAKNHDYGEAWRDMRVSSFTDLILMKLLRIKQIEDNKGKTLVSEGIDAGYMDIVNYSIFALIQMSGGK